MSSLQMVKLNETSAILRAERGRVMRELRAGTATVDGLLADGCPDALAGVPVFRLLEAVRYFGPERLTVINSQALKGREVDGLVTRVNLFRHLGDLTDRQRRLVIDLSQFATPEHRRQAQRVRKARDRAQRRARP